MSGEEIIHTTYKHMEVTGKIASVRNSLSRNQPVIIVKDKQINEKINHEVTVYHLKRDSKSVGLAFSFRHNDQTVFSVVDGDDVKPVDELRTVVFEMLKKKEETQVNVCWNLGDANSVTMAFGFLHKGKMFSPVVEGNEIKLDLKTDMQTAILDKICLFQWYEKTGEWGILKSVAEPQKYLRIFNNKVTVGTSYQAFEFQLKSVN
nr:uncharacterized protein LOC115120000 [Oncorhynchus nerka]